MPRAGAPAAGAFDRPAPVVEVFAPVFRKAASHRAQIGIKGERTPEAHAVFARASPLLGDEVTRVDGFAPGQGYEVATLELNY
jgi:hypothetical protein